MVKKDYQKAIDYAHKLLEVEKANSHPDERLKAYRNIKDSYSFLNNHAEENKYLKLYTVLNDSINASEKRAIVHQSREQIQKSDVKNEKSKRSFLLIGVGVILIIVLISWLLVRRNNKILRRNYEQMIKKLKAQALAANDVAQEYNDIEPLKNEENDVFANKNVISADTEARILRSLNAFEKSGKFLRKDMTMSLLSAQLNTNSKYLSEIIRDHKSQNFNNYLTNLRINYILQKLYNEPRYRDYKISYLAEECGYASPQVFVLAFKKINGVTPSYFIDSLKEDENLIFN